jgi:serpin B
MEGWKMKDERVGVTMSRCIRSMSRAGGVGQGWVLGLSAFLIAFLIGAWLVPPARAASDKEIVTDGNNAFALDLYKEIRDGAKGENIFFSPASISGALAMTYAGARGRTASQMAQTLHFTLAPKRLHPAFAEVLAGLGGGAGAELSVANALWGQSGMPFRREFLNIVKSYYHGDFREVDFSGQPDESRRTINRWVEERTHKKIKELLHRGDIGAGTRLVLTDAVYFKGTWLSRFESALTAEGPFHLESGKTVRAPMMKQQGKFGFFEDDMVQILEMPYAGENLSMVVLLPQDGITLEGVEKQLIPQNLNGWLAGLSEMKVKVELPRFRASRYFKLKDALIALGMKDTFGGEADFSGMAAKGKVSIDEVVHKAFVEVNEEGTEAAAATAVVGKGAGRGGAHRTPLFKADHPFIYMIRDRQSGSIIFMGRLMNTETG